MEITKYLERYQRRIQPVLKKLLPSTRKEPKHLHRAMNYSVLNGGKRLRAAFIYIVGEALGANNKLLDHIAAAIEMIHAGSLIHDDLPAIDNDDLRRGIPSCHKAFGEATAIIAGDALQTLAFQILSNLDKKLILPSIELEMISILSRYIGSVGVAGGEELDIEMVNSNVSVKKLEYMYKRKTADLLTAGILLSALAAGCQDKKILSNLRKFCENIGLAFQIHDDIIGIISDTKTLGKTQGKDAKLNKPIYPVLVGMEKAKKREKILVLRGLRYLDKTKIKSDKLKALTSYVIQRNY